jgi:hypothetical protein
MRIYIFALLLALSFPQLAQAQCDNQIKTAHPEASDYVNRKHDTAGGNYYIFTITEQDTFNLTWGNDKFTRTEKFGACNEASYHIVSTVKLQAENADYMILRYGDDAQKWSNLVIPLNEKEPIQKFNGINYFDANTNNITTIGGRNPKDKAEITSAAALVIHSLKTGDVQYISFNRDACPVDNKECIKALKLDGDALYIKWESNYNYSTEKPRAKLQKIDVKLSAPVAQPAADAKPAAHPAQAKPSDR